MPRYRANVTFGPWKKGEIFESENDFHATLGTEGRLLSVIGQTPPPVVLVEDDEETDNTSEEEADLDDEES